jgi:simple sugar transport system ATP-binding protein
MQQVLEVADRAEVLRLGSRVAQFRIADATVNLLVAAMTGGLDEGPAAADPVSSQAPEVTGE